MPPTPEINHNRAFCVSPTQAGFWVHPRHTRFPRLAWLLLLFAANLCSAQSPGVVTKIVERLHETDWLPFPTYSTAGLTIHTTEGLDVRPGPRSEGAPNFRVEPALPIPIPGNALSLSLKLRSTPSVRVRAALRDGLGRDSLNGMPLEVAFPVPNTTDWETVTVEIPQDIARPVSIRALVIDNLPVGELKSEPHATLAELGVTTDLSQADPSTGRYLAWKPDPSDERALKSPPDTPLLSLEFSSSQHGHVFAGKKPRIYLSMRNWNAEPVAGRLEAQFSADNEKILADSKEISVKDVAKVSWDPPQTKFGPFKAEAILEWQGQRAQASLRYACVPPLHKLTAQQKDRSPYGLNYHSPGDVFLDPFLNAGLIWFREYAFVWDRFPHAKGPENRFTGERNFQRIIKSYMDVDARVVPVLQKSIPRMEVVDGKILRADPPDRTWIAQLASILLAFPQVKFWELDNEYDLNGATREAEKLLNWSHYHDYHRVFGSVVSLIGNGELVAVENGRAGIHPEPLALAIESGAFENIGVANVHHYTGVEPPEVNIGNYNTAGGGLGVRQSGLYADELRAAVAAAQLDGKPRPVWLTEIGWDTVAGKVVSEEQQAAYLVRGWMLSAAAGIEKSFWFFNFDGREANNFFDGCGLLTNRRQPKPSLAALAGMTHLLPELNYVGCIEAGPGTAGYVFIYNDQLIASLWTIFAEENPPVVDFDPDVRVHDIFANLLEGRQATLGISPIYAAGISPLSKWYKQTAYSLGTQQLMSATAGEETQLVLHVRNNRTTAIEAVVSPQLPEGWTTPATSGQISVPAGQSENFAIQFTIPKSEKAGIHDLSLEIHEGDLLKTIPARVRIFTPITVTARPFEGSPAKAAATVEVANLTSQTQEVTVDLQLPSTWKNATEPLSVTLEPGERATRQAAFQWSPDVPSNESAFVSAHANGFTARAPLIPPALKIKRIDGWFDGDPARWPEANKVPSWMLGSTIGPASADAWIGWTEEGLWGAFDVRDSKVLVTDPRPFWSMDALEIFIDTLNKKGDRKFTENDHQFWLVPLPEENRVYLGRWRTGVMKEILYDIPGIRSASRKTASGYAMEFLIPWNLVQGGEGRPGKKLGFNFNLSVRGPDADREVYWHRPKEKTVMADPGSWGSATLVE